MLRAPVSRMDILTPAEISAINRSSVLVQKYSQIIDRESAYEILTNKVSEAKVEAKAETKVEVERKEGEGHSIMKRHVSMVEGVPKRHRIR